jgi:guanosine-diphosphatase
MPTNVNLIGFRCEFLFFVQVDRGKKTETHRYRTNFPSTPQFAQPKFIKMARLLLRYLMVCALAIAIGQANTIPPVSKNGVLTPSVDKQSSNNFASKKNIPQLEKYSIIIDAGSSGSRVHVYKASMIPSTGLFQLVDEKVLKVEPGLSSFASSSKLAVNSLQPLLEFAKDNVPLHLHKCTTISLKATAGLRLLGANQTEEILNAVTRNLREFPFPLSKDEKAVTVMDGYREGLYSWIALNKLLATKEALPARTTAVMLDLGGGSTQIAYTLPKSSKKESSLREQVYLDDNKYIVYRNSFLGYGIREAIKKVGEALKGAAHHPCYPAWLTSSISSGLPQSMNGNLDEKDCVKIVQETLFSPAPLCSGCTPTTPGTLFPKIPARRPIFAISAFYYFFSPLLPHFPQSNLKKQTIDATHFITNLNSLLEIRSSICSKVYNTKDSVKSSPLTKEIEEIRQHFYKYPDLCINLTYATQLLAAYHVSGSREINLIHKISNFQVSWSLGAAFNSLHSTENAAFQCPKPKASL